MTHLSPTLDAPVILSSSPPGQRKLLLLFLRCCYCLPIHKDKVSWWPLRESLDGPLVAPLRVFSLLSPWLQSWGQCQSVEAGAGVMWLVWVLWKDVWNRSMGIRDLGSVGGLLCWRLSPLLASMISSIDTEALHRSVCVFFCHPLPTTPSPSFLPAADVFFFYLPSSAPSAVSQSQKIWSIFLFPVSVNWIYGHAFNYREWWQNSCVSPSCLCNLIRLYQNTSNKLTDTL